MHVWLALPVSCSIQKHIEGVLVLICEKLDYILKFHGASDNLIT